MLNGRYRFAIHAAAALLAARVVVAQAPAGPTGGADRTAALALSDRMPLDPAVEEGTLPNGLRYYVRTNHSPARRAELRLVVKAGSILEDEDQRGLAHVVEHMAFNGTAHFPGHGITAFLESLGMRFGADLNAYTSFDETVYMLQVPTDAAGTMDRAMTVLEDWAHNVTFDPAVLDKERGVVTEEWRQRRGAAARLQEHLLPILLAGSRYPDRMPIGSMDVVQHFPPDRLTAFYHDWYRPDLMAVVAVGDFDREAVANLVKLHFAALKGPLPERPRPAFSVPDRPGTAFASETDKETTTTSVELQCRLPSRPDGTVAAYRQKIVDRMFVGLLAGRLTEIARKPDAPILGASLSRAPFVARGQDTTTLVAVVPENGIERGFDAVATEVERVKRFGFTPTEVDRQKQNVLRGWERTIAERDAVTSAARAAEYIRNFLSDEMLPSLDDEYALQMRLMPSITAEEVARPAREWFPSVNRTLIVTGPDKPGTTLPDQAKLEAVLTSVAGRALTAYVDTATATSLMAEPPAAGPPIAATKTRDSLGITEWTLANGVTVVLKPTDFKQDEILFRAVSPGGTSLASDADFIPASAAGQAVGATGVGPYSTLDLRKIMTGKIATANPFITELSEGLTGSASPRDLETLFQLIYLRFTEPRRDPAAVAVMTNQLKALLANQTATPAFALTDALVRILSQDHPRRRLPTTETINKWDLDKSLAFYKDRFADASGFTFVFVGTLDPAIMKPLVERYLGTLPATHRHETWKDVGVRPPTGVIEKTIAKGSEPKTSTAIVYSGPLDHYDQAHLVALKAMGDLLGSRLLSVIREQLGGAYSVNTNTAATPRPAPEFAVTIGFTCDPARLDELVGRVYKEIEAFKAAGPTEAQLADERAALERTYETSMRQNGFLLGQLSVAYELGEDPGDVWALGDRYKQLDAASVQAAARTYLKGDNRVQLTLAPEKQ